MTRKTTRIIDRATKAGRHAATELGRPLTAEEMAELRVQIWPWLPRILLVILGIFFLGWAWQGWLGISLLAKILISLIGIMAILSGAFGLRKSLREIALNIDIMETGVDLFSLVGKGISSIFNALT
jgi:hypothetical protein